MKALLAKQKMINKVILIPEYKIKPIHISHEKCLMMRKLTSWQPVLHSMVCFSQSQCFRWRMELSAGCRRKKTACLQKAAHAGSSSDFDQHG